MKIPKKSIFVCLLIGIIFPGGYLLTKSFLYYAGTPQSEIETPTNPNISSVNESEKPPIFQFPDNSNLPPNMLIKIEEAIGNIDPKAKVKEAKLQNYSEFIKQRNKTSDIMLESGGIHPNRQVWSVIIDFSQGLETEQGTYTKATVTQLLDAQTGEFISLDIQAPPGAFTPAINSGINQGK